MSKSDRLESVADANNVTFKVGDGVHWGFNGDAYPGTVVGISRSGREVYVNSDDFIIDESDRGLKEGARKGTFKTVSTECNQYTRKFKLFARNGRFCESSSRGNVLNKERIWAQNPSF